MSVMTLLDVYDPADGQRAAKVLYDLMRERSTEQDANVNISHRALPPFEEHLAYYEKRPYHAWYLILVDGICAGSVSATKRNEIGIVLFQEHRGKGYGKRAVELFMATVLPLPAVPGSVNGHWLANINPRNERSIRLFRSLGFNLIQHTYELA